jgi:hypothetical protein
LARAPVAVYLDGRGDNAYVWPPPHYIRAHQLAIIKLSARVILSGGKTSGGIIMSKQGPLRTMSGDN